MWIRIQKVLAKERKKNVLKIYNYFLKILQNLSCVIFSVTMQEKG